MSAELAGRVAVVTGTGHGIGAAIAHALEGHGATVHGCDKDTVDATDSEQVDAFIAGIGTVDILVNNAGGVAGQVGRPLEDVSDGDWRTIVDTNLTSTFFCTRAVVPGMKGAGYGRIVNISSGAGRSVSLTGIQAYAGAKAAQIGFTRQMAHELGLLRHHRQQHRPRVRALATRPPNASGKAMASRASRHCSRRSRPGAWVSPGTSPTACSSSSRTPRRGSRGRPSRSMAVIPSFDERERHLRELMGFLQIRASAATTPAATRCAPRPRGS